MPRLPAVKKVVLLCTLLGTTGCSAVDEWMFGPDPEPSARALRVADTDPRQGYPSVSSVPQRPQLSYTVEQEREVVDGLVSDRDNALYTSGLIRYRSGVSRNVPPAPPPDYRSLRGDQVIGPEVAVAPAVPSTFAPGAEVVDETTPRTLPPEPEEFDDGGLDDFVRGLVDETGADPGLGTETALIDRRRSQPTPGQKGDESAFERLFLWVAEQLGGSADEPAEQPATPDDPGRKPTPPDDAAPAEGSVPKLKPHESADPPEPAPAKPDEPDQARDQDPPATTEA